jgi:D-lyxose ketol-isomerase
MLTIRNGNYFNKKYVKPYAEKILITQEGQITPYHYHAKKMEDIINRGGGNLIVKMYNSVSPKKFADTDVMVTKDGCSYFVKAGEEVCVAPGESITLHPGVFHCFWGEVGKGPVLLGEVSMVNDDNNDNRFYEKQARFTTIEEDEEPLYLLCNEYEVK